MVNLNRILVAASSLLASIVGCADSPGTTKDDCAQSPQQLTIDPLAPFWGGLTRLNFKVPGSPPDSVQTQVFNSVAGVWEDSFMPLQQRDDGDFSVLTFWNVTSETKDATFKIRLRSKLDGCPASSWAVSEPIKLSNPLTDTAWATTIPLELSSTAFRADVVAAGMIPGTTVGPYSYASQGIVHAMQFNAPDIVEETWSFKVNSAIAGDLYDNCSFVIRYIGKWRFVSENSSNLQLLISDLKPAPDALAGSVCANPPVGEMAAAQPGYPGRQPNTQPMVDIDYARLQYSPPGNARWVEDREISRLASIIAESIVDVVGPDTAQPMARFNTPAISYDKK
jgi:hypothetical protein